MNLSYKDALLTDEEIDALVDEELKRVPPGYGRGNHYTLISPEVAHSAASWPEPRSLDDLDQQSHYNTFNHSS